MSWYRNISIGTPQIFSPKVTPDPTAAERLEEKFQQALLDPSQQIEKWRSRAPKVRKKTG